jgi:hypothetical protein
VRANGYGGGVVIVGLVTGRLLVCFVTGLMGVVFRVQDTSNFYYAYVDSTTKTLVAGIVRFGSGYTPLTTANIPTFTTNSPVTLVVNMTSTGFEVTVSDCTHVSNSRASYCVVTYQASDVSVAVTDTSHTQGSAGVLSAGVGWFDDFSLSTSCDGDTQCYSTLLTGHRGGFRSQC